MSKPLDTDKQGCLFDHSGIDLVSERRLPKVLQVKNHSRLARSMALRLVVDNTAPVKHRSEQLTFELDAVRQTLLPYLSRTTLQYLEYGVFDTFGDIPKARKAAVKLEKLGVVVIGQLVQLRPGVLLSYNFITDEIYQLMSDRLSKAGLKFGLNLPHWNRAHPSAPPLYA